MDRVRIVDVDDRALTAGRYGVRVIRHADQFDPIAGLVLAAHSEYPERNTHMSTATAMLRPTTARRSVHLILIFIRATP
jgi:hypothetical protein